MKTHSLAQAIDKLLAGGVGVLPTDTVYGLVARAADPLAVKRFYGLKDREHKPGTVVAASVEQLIELGVEPSYLRRVERWWPAALSVETPLGPALSYLHQETGRQALRVVADERLRQVLEQTGPLVTSSANRPGEVGSTTVAEAIDYFGDRVDFYVDGGDLSGRAPSTIIRVVADEIEVIRQGAVEIDAAGMHYITPSLSDCPFCRANGRLKGQVLAATDNAFLIGAQSNPGCFLIVPDTHVETLGELPDTWWAEVKVLLVQVPSLPADYNVSINIGAAAGQTVHHLHFWIVPRMGGHRTSGKGLARLIDEAEQA